VAPVLINKAIVASISLTACDSFQQQAEKINTADTSKTYQATNRQTYDNFGAFTFFIK
jgi:hypothetical protein|tara:strand:+ start:119 stop:292 length:174 start_codon:yes stop_codon:yes gene_type:complete